MRIKEIEINNFKALGSSYKIDLTNSCKNLLIYGENGSGKSSLFKALNCFSTHHKKKRIFRSIR
ncbi:AAA family ATPase [candidate division KSB1 bacterium]|nr:AAA family ATPase [candidate division KSB1 bacterium]